MNDPVINSSEWDWDTASTAEAWKHSHNYVHHTFTNIRGKDKDLGYEIMRIDPHQDWHPAYLLQPIYNLILAALFEWGVALHDMDFEAIRSGEKSQKQVLKDLNGIFYKARLQVTKDYIAWPIVSGVVMTLIDLGLAAAGVDLEEAEPRIESRAEKAKRQFAKVRRRSKRRRATGIEGLVRQLVDRKSFREPFKRTLLANVVANIIRNLWSYAIIFCGHFPDQTYTFSQEETKDETPGRRYVRQLIGAANIEGGPMFHVISGNLGYQVEHHLYPDMPSTRYGEIAPRVREICKRYDLPYNTGPFMKQLTMVQRTIIRLAFPGGKPRPKPGPYRGDVVIKKGEQDLQTAAAASASSNGGA
jgi:NADPH-dependent stearoyl-CoA 9-desaturase